MEHENFVLIGLSIAHKKRDKKKKKLRGLTIDVIASQKKKI